MARGNLALDQLQSGIPTGNGIQITTFGGGPKTPGNTSIWDADGNLIDSGSSAVATGHPVLDTASGNPIITDSGDYIFV